MGGGEARDRWGSVSRGDLGLAWPFWVAAAQAENHFSRDKLASLCVKKRSTCMVETTPGIVVDPAVRFGKPVIQGTRIPVALVLEKLAGGMTPAMLRQEYDLETKDILAALCYAAILVAGEVLHTPPQSPALRQ
jgi:uncharacterized protein (DUF433 family)